MPVFTYQAKNNQGELVRGLIEAGSYSEAEKELVRNRDLTWVVSIKKGDAAGKGGVLSEARKEVLADRRKLSLVDYVLLCQKMGVLLNAGIPILASIDTMLETINKKQLHACLTQISEKIQEGRTISEGFGLFPKVFSNFFVNMVKVGETSGALDSVFRQMADYYAEINGVVEKVRSAITYPAFIFGITTALFLFTTFFVLPKFEDLYNSLKVPLPFQTRFLLGTGHVIRSYFLVIVGAIAALIVGVGLWRRSPQGKAWFDRTILKVPVFGPLMHEFYSLLFVRAFGIMLNTGVHVFSALEICAQVVNNAIYEKAILKANDRIRSGVTMGQAFKEMEILHPIAKQMISIGEKSGAVGPLLEKAAGFFEMDIRSMATRITAAVEPTMLVIMGVGVGFLVFSLYIPIFTMARHMAK